MVLAVTRHRFVCLIVLTVFWINAVYNFVLQEVTGDQMASIELGVRLLSQFVLAMTGLCLLRSRTDIIILSVFTVFTLYGTCVVNEHSVLTWVDGVRTYFGFLFVIPIFRYLYNDPVMRPRFIHSMERALFLFLWLQVPCIVFQYARHVNLDYVGGSLGWMMSGVISNLIYLISFYLMLRRWDYGKSYFANLMANWILVFLLFPTFLNETKISFVYMLLYFVLLIPIDAKYIKRLIWTAPLVLVMLLGAGFLYTKVVGDNSGVDSQAAVEVYVMGDDSTLYLMEHILENDSEEVMQKDFARGLKFFITPAIMDRQPSAWPWGYGLGQYKMGDGAKKSKFAQRYFWLLQGTIIQAHVTWLEAGLIGLGMYVLYWLSVFRVFRRRLSRNLQLQWMLGFMVLIFSVYNAPFFVIPFIIIFLFLVYISSRWGEMPPYRYIKLLGSRPIRFSMSDDEESRAPEAATDR